MFIAMGPVFVYRYYEMGVGSLSVAVLLTMAAGGATLAWVRRGGSSTVGGVLLTAELLMLLVYSNYCSGGVEDPNFGWLYVIPMLGALLVNARTGWIFTGVVFVVTLAFWAAPEFGVEIPNYIPENFHRDQTLANRLSAIIAIGVLLAALASQQNFSRGLLERVNNELTYEMNQRSEMQARMVRSERAASMGSLAAGIAHEINNPLTYVIGNLELLQSGATSGDATGSGRKDGEAQTMLSEATEGAYRVASLVRDLKTFSQTDEGKAVPVALRSTIDRVTKMTANEFRHRAKLRVECPEGVRIMGNEGRILQVLINLLTNAAHAIEPGSQEANTVKISVYERDSRVELEVADSGGGIDPEIADRIFEPFFTTKSVGFGMGMGLSITRNIIHALGGTIELKYSSPEGSSFVISLDSAEAENPVPEVEAGDGAPGVVVGGALNILVIDDEERVLSLLQTSLSHHRVSVELDGRKAIDRIAAEDFDIVLCDLMMPRMTGMEMHAELKRMRPEAAERMIFMTGGVFVEEAEEFLRSVPGRWIEKPIDFGELESQIWQRMKARTQADPSITAT